MYRTCSRRPLKKANRDSIAMLLNVGRLPLVHLRASSSGGKMDE